MLYFLSPFSTSYPWNERNHNPIQLFKLDSRILIWHSCDLMHEDSGNQRIIHTVQYDVHSIIQLRAPAHHENKQSCCSLVVQSITPNTRTSLSEPISVISAIALDIHITLPKHKSSPLFITNWARCPFRTNEDLKIEESTLCLLKRPEAPGMVDSYMLATIPSLLRQSPYMGSHIQMQWWLLHYNQTTKPFDPDLWCRFPHSIESQLVSFVSDLILRFFFDGKKPPLFFGNNQYGVTCFRIFPLITHWSPLDSVVCSSAVFCTVHAWKLGGLTFKVPQKVFQPCVKPFSCSGGSSLLLSLTVLLALLAWIGL